MARKLPRMTIPLFGEYIRFWSAFANKRLQLGFRRVRLTLTIRRRGGVRRPAASADPRPPPTRGLRRPAASADPRPPPTRGLRRPAASADPRPPPTRGLR